MKKEMEILELELVKKQFEKHCAFSMGIQEIRQASPHYDRLWVTRELARVKEAYDLVVRYGAPSFAGIKDLRLQLQDAAKGRTLGAMDLRFISDEIRAVENIQAYFQASEASGPMLQELVDALGDVRKVAVRIDACISVNGEVYDHASAALKTIRKAISGCLQDISQEVTRFISRNHAKLMDTVTTIRNGRTCVLVKISEKNSIDGFIRGESASGQTAYIEPRSLIVLNNRLQSLKSQEESEIERILHSLTLLVKEHAFALLGNLDTFALLDSIFAKGLWAKEMDGCVATIVQPKELFIKQARHPLISKEQVVANTYKLQAPHHSLLITGSNTGGKTVTLKTIGLFVAMTLCGMPISCESAHIPMVDAIFVDIGDAQSIQESLSTFSSHISKLAKICDQVTAKSLVLLDELGGGTDPKEGEALAVAILDALRQSGAMIIATTHYSALKSYATQHEDILLSSVEFDMEAMRPTYRYIEGISGRSNALEIARRYGLKESILSNAAKRMEEGLQEQDKLMMKLEASRMELYEQKEKLHHRLDDVKKLQAELAHEKESFLQEKQRLIEALKQEQNELLAAKEEEAQSIIEELKQLQSDAKPHEIITLESQLAKLKEEEENSTTSEESFAVGDYVLLKKYNYYGEIITLQKDRVCVLANGMRMNVTTADITHAKKKEQKKVKKNYTPKGIKTISLECNVIGMRVNEALPIIDKYLDDALLAKASTVRLVHGVGTGALRKAIHSYLKQHPRVESYRMGGQGEGGLGASIVTLKQKGAK